MVAEYESALFGTVTISDICERFSAASGVRQCAPDPQPMSPPIFLKFGGYVCLSVCHLCVKFHIYRRARERAIAKLRLGRSFWGNASIGPEDIDSKYDSETAIRQIVREPICSSQAFPEEVMAGQSFSMSPRSVF